MWSKLKPLPRGIIIVALIGGIVYGGDYLLGVPAVNQYFKEKPTLASSVPQGVDLPNAAVQSGPGSASSEVTTSAVSSNTTIRLKTIPWNGTAGLFYANGDQDTASGSLMAKRGVKLRLDREDDYSKMTADMVAFAKNNSNGVHFVIIMGDGYAAFYRGVQEALAPLGHSAEVIGAVGFSRGEDKCIIDADAQVKGSLIGAVLRDGDWNICVKYAADNGIAINPDERTYDPNAMNFVAVNSFTEADEKFIAGYCENRDVVVSGKRTGDKQRVCVNGTATWFPGDEKVARERGNLRVLASTKEYVWQMPTIVIGNKKWNAENRQLVENFLAAAFEGGERVRADNNALLKSGAVLAKVNNELDGATWAKFHRGATITDKQGKRIEVGGSTTIGLGDNAFLFGLNGNDNIYKKVYTVFGNITKHYYPELMPAVPSYEQAVNTAYVQSLLGKATTVARADVPTFTGQRGEQFAAKAYAIEFDTGKATFGGSAVRVLNEILDNVAVSGLSVQIEGHTDSVGGSELNLALSKRRADAVKQFLQANAPANFPDARVTTRGFGDTAPIASNNTAEGRAKNRRVEVKLFRTQ